VYRTDAMGGSKGNFPGMARRITRRQPAGKPAAPSPGLTNPLSNTLSGGREVADVRRLSAEEKRVMWSSDLVRAVGPRASQ
jgi:hypothetical protein